MATLCEAYILPHSVAETIAVLSDARGSGRIIGGGTDLLLEIQQGSHPPARLLVDVTEVGEMRAIEIRDESIFIGASVTLTQLVESPLVNKHAQVLVEAASLMANPQVCNVATIGGNVAHALPAADGTISLLALDAQVEVANTAGRHMVPIQSLFKGPGVSTLDPGQDLLVGFYLPQINRGQASAFARRVNPQGIALAILNMAIWLERRGDRITNIRIAVGPSGLIPLRMVQAEKVFLGLTPSAEVLVRSMDELLMEAHFRTSPHRATAEYRRHLAGILLQEAFTKAWQRAG